MNVTKFQRRALATSEGEASMAVGMGMRPSERSPLLIQYLSIARRQKGVILGAILGGLVIALIFTLLISPKYTATSTLEIRRETPSIAAANGAQQMVASGPEDLEFYQTQYGLLESRSLAEKVATSLRLYDSASFFEMAARDKAREWFDNDRVRPNVSTREQRVREAGQALLKNFSVNPERQSRLVYISYTSPDPEFARKVVSVWGERYIDSTLDRRYQASSYARRFLEQRLADLRTQINDSERELVNYAGREGIVNLPSSETTDDQGRQPERSLVADDLTQLNRELAAATADRVAAQSRLKTAGSAAPETLQNQAITGLRQKRAELAADYARMMVQFEPSYPPAMSIQKQIEQLDKAIGQEERRISQTIQEAYVASVSRESDLKARVNTLKGELLDTRRRSIQYNIIQRDAETDRELYKALLQRYKEIGVAGGVGVNNISIVDPPELPEDPSSPKLLLNLFAGLLLGTIIGAGAAFALEQMDQGISAPDELEQAAGFPVLGTVPRSEDGTSLEELSDRKSSIAEAYVSAQTNLAFSTDHGIPKTLAVTSSRASEGKTTTSTALAISIARNGRRVLLVDADMRSPSLHGNFGLRNLEGFSNFLSGNNELDGLIHDSGYLNLSLMTAGPQPPSAPELLSSSRFGVLIGLLLERFDHVVFDGPPVMGLADAPLIASNVEGLIFVVEANGTDRSVVQNAVHRLVSANAPIVGCILTKFDQKRAHYGYGYDYGYGHDADRIGDDDTAEAQVRT